MHTHTKNYFLKKRFLAILFLALFFAIATKSVSAQANPDVLYVPLIGITSVPDPLALPGGAGSVTYHYAVKNFLMEAPLTAVHVLDDGCTPIVFAEGDDDGDGALDYSETWRYSCTKNLSVTSESTATATGAANNLITEDTAYATVVVGSSTPAPLVSVVNITKVAYPFSLPAEGGSITFTYRINNPGAVPLSDVRVTDNKCANMSGKLGDTNGNNLLDTSEVWIYHCTTNLAETTTNTATVTAFANGLQAFDSYTLTVKVAQTDGRFVPGFPKTGIAPNPKIIVWKILSGILAVLIIAAVITRKKQ